MEKTKFLILFLFSRKRVNDALISCNPKLLNKGKVALLHFKDERQIHAIIIGCEDIGTPLRVYGPPSSVRKRSVILTCFRVCYPTSARYARSQYDKSLQNIACFLLISKAC
jgi:hypothetical protein